MHRAVVWGNHASRGVIAIRGMRATPPPPQRGPHACAITLAWNRPAVADATTQAGLLRAVHVCASRLRVAGCVWRCSRARCAVRCACCGVCVLIMCAMVMCVCVARVTCSPPYAGRCPWSVWVHTSVCYCGRVCVACCMWLRDGAGGLCRLAGCMSWVFAVGVWALSAGCWLLCGAGHMLCVIYQVQGCGCVFPRWFVVHALCVDVCCVRGGCCLASIATFGLSN